MSTSNNDQQLNRLLQERGIDMPSPDFTDQVMDRIEALPQSKPIEYKPLIGRLGWLAIGLGAIGFLVAVIMNAGQSSTVARELPSIGNYLPQLPAVDLPYISPTLLLAVLGLWLLVVVERVVDRMRSRGQF